MENDKPLKWKLKLTAELGRGECVEYDLTGWERGAEVTLGSLGLSLAEGKAILAEIQTRMVAAQIECHGEARRCCGRCGRRLPNKGHYRSTFRSAFGNVPVRVRRVKACSGCGQNPAAPLFTRKSSTAPELRYLNAKLAALMPFGKVADFLNEVLPDTAATNAVTVRNRTRRVGGRLLREQAKPAGSARPTPSQALVIGLDGGFVKSNRPLSERNFEVTAGKVLGEEGECTRFAFATNEYEHGLRQIRHALEELRVDEKTQITVLSDGDAGLRTVQWEVAPGSEHILDWFHIGMRFEHLLDASRAMQKVAPAAHGSESALDLATRAKWALWNGQADKTFARLEELRRWPLAERGPTPEVRNLHRHATDLLKYLRANQDSLPDYGERQREGEPFSTGWVESAINEIIAKRMAKAQQMRWNRWTVQPFLAVRTAVLNDTLANSFRDWFRGFRPVDPKIPELQAA
jgi:Transposase